MTEDSFLKDYPQFKMVDFQIKDENRRVVCGQDKGPSLQETLDKLPKEEKECRIRYMVTVMILYSKAGDRASRRRETINDWIQRDTLRDEKRAKIWEQYPENTRKRCRKCGGLMKCFNKDFYDTSEQKDRILFMYECLNPDCKYREAEFEDGEIWKKEEPKCPNCNVLLKESQKRLKEKIRYYSKCPQCDFKDSWDLDLSNKAKKKTKADIDAEKLMERDKLRFCLSEKEGAEYRQSCDSMKRFHEIMAKEKEAEKVGESFQQIKLLEKIPFLEAQKRIKEKLKGKKFLKLKFGDPNMGRDVVFEFKIYEGDPTRSEYDAKKELKTLIGKALNKTNWKLMSEGISSRMGIFSGRIRGVEHKTY